MTRNNRSFVSIVALLTLFFWFYWYRYYHTTTATSAQTKTKYDAIIVLGGGLDQDGTPHPFVQERIRTAARYSSDTQYYILSSRGTPHKAPPRDGNNYPLDESVVGARALRSLLPNQSGNTLLLDTWSYDTIGNAWFALINFIEPLRLTNCLVVTSQFHMPRASSIFEHVFSLATATIPVNVDFVASSDVGLDPQTLTLRQRREASSLQQWSATKRQVTSKQKLAHFIFVEHGAYKTNPTTTLPNKIGTLEELVKNSY
jgi:uncharacterized SAM-binding protein YcdF (DUF218 family)